MTAPHTAPPPWQHRLPFYYGYLMVAVAYVLAFANAGQMWSFGVLSTSMEHDLGWSRSMLFGALTVRGITQGLVAPIIGRLADQRSGVRPVLAASGLLSALSVFLIAGMTEPWQFVLLFGVMGGAAGAGQGFVMGAVVVPKWFIRKRSSMVAFTSMGGATSLLLLPPLVGMLAAAEGWRPVWHWLAVLSLLAGILPPLLVRRQPEDIGLRPDGDPPATGTVAGGAPSTPPADASMTLQQALKGRNFWLLTLGTALGSLPMTAATVAIPPLLLDRGLTPELAATGMSGFGLASFAVRFLWGPLADRHHIRTVLIAISLVCTLVTLSIFALPGQFSVAYGAVLGFGIGGYVGLYQAVWAAYYGRRHLGSIAGVTQPFVTFVMASGSVLLAAIRDATGSYDMGIILFAAAWLSCGLLLFAAKPRPITRSS